MLVKDLILSNPELPLVVVAWHEDSCDFYGFKDIYEAPEGHIGEVFQHSDFEDDFGVKTFFSHEDLEEAVYEKSSKELSDEELKAELAKYAPYWKKSIILEL